METGRLPSIAKSKSRGAQQTLAKRCGGARLQYTAGKLFRSSEVVREAFNGEDIGRQRRIHSVVA